MRLRRLLGSMSTSVICATVRFFQMKNLPEFGVIAEEVFSRNATLSALRMLIGCVDDWLNGAIFDIPWQDAITEAHIRSCGSIFW